MGKIFVDTGTIHCMAIGVSDANLICQPQWQGAWWQT